jgi:transmembrane sensor
LATSGKKQVERLEAKAAAWAAKIDAFPDQAHPELDGWIAEHPKHAGALLRAQAALALFSPTSHADERPPIIAARPFWRRPAILATGGAALAASFAAMVLISPHAETYKTQTGEVRFVALSEGSSVAIDSRSHIEIDFDAASRDVHLESGRVLFRAAHNARRPFRVIVDKVVITDMGTAFQVDDNDRTGNVEVLVTEGAVRVDTPTGTLELQAGERAFFSQKATGAAPTAARLDQPAVERQLAWREGRLELNGETLDSAVVEINRHSRLQLIVGSEALGRQRLYGSFRTDDAPGFARAAAVSLGVDARAEPDGIVIGFREKVRPD